MRERHQRLERLALEVECGEPVGERDEDAAVGHRRRRPDPVVERDRAVVARRGIGDVQLATLDVDPQQAARGGVPARPFAELRTACDRHLYAHGCGAYASTRRDTRSTVLHARGRSGRPGCRGGTGDRACARGGRLRDRPRDRPRPVRRRARAGGDARDRARAARRRRPRRARVLARRPRRRDRPPLVPALRRVRRGLARLVPDRRLPRARDHAPARVRARAGGRGRRPADPDPAGPRAPRRPRRADVDLRPRAPARADDRRPPAVGAPARARRRRGRDRAPDHVPAAPRRRRGVDRVARAEGRARRGGRSAPRRTRRAHRCRSSAGSTSSSRRRATPS